MKRIRVLVVIVLAMLFSLSASVVSAGSSTQEGVTVTTPQTYASCVNAVTSDIVSITGLTDTGLTMRGQVIVDFVTDSGRQQIALVPVDTMSDFDVPVSYPPVNSWPVLANGTKEIHVDIQLELWVFNTNNVMVASFGGGLDWDVFCLNDPSPPPPPSGGTEGCTPGYWKQPHHFDSYPVPYTPSTTFKSVFGVGPNSTLPAAAGTGGGGEKALVRHATAALLNAGSSDVDYKYTTAEVIAMVQNAYATKNFEATKNLFEAANEKGCSLN